MLKSNGCWLSILVFLGTTVSLTVFVLIYLLSVLPKPSLSAEVVSTPPGQILALPTAPPSSQERRPPLPSTVKFTAKNPIRGFSDCETYGFRGIISPLTADPLPDVQVVVWTDQLLMVGLEQADVSGIYEINLADPPPTPVIWIQLYQNDLPVSQPISLEIETDCLAGYQLYQIDWQEIAS